jgi:hypothetical protein
MEDVNTPVQRPKGLFALLILTFINTGSAILFGILTLLFFKPTEADLNKERVEMAKSIGEFTRALTGND